MNMNSVNLAIFSTLVYVTIIDGLYTKRNLSPTPHRIRREITAEEVCEIPPPLQYGTYKPSNRRCSPEKNSPACRLLPGAFVPSYWILHISCNDGYIVNRNVTTSVCVNGQWTPALPTCNSPREFCILPDPLLNGRYRSSNRRCHPENNSPACKLLPGTSVPPEWVIYFTCDDGYGLNTNVTFSACIKGQWNPTPPVCNKLKLCPPLRPYGIDVQCIFKNQNISCTKPMLPGTVATQKCDQYYQPAYEPESTILTCLNTGTWDYLPFHCIPGEQAVSSSEIPPGTHQVYNHQGEQASGISIIKLCPPLKSEMLLMSCRHGEDIVDCSKPALSGTTVTFECAPTFLEYPEQSRQGAYSKVNTCRSSGEWSAYLPTCKTSCGVFNKDLKVLTPTIVGGQEAHLGFFPWHAGLYYRREKDGLTVWKLRCAGSLITNRLILTTAHCLIVIDVNDLRVAVGKYYRSWDRNEPSEQKRNVTKISYPSLFSKTTFLFDIGLVLVSERIRFGEYVMPVCRDMYPAREYFQNSTLYIAGWGSTEEGGTSPSEVLLYNTVKAVPKDECLRKIPSVFPTFARFCAAKYNSSVSIVQPGDVGGGLTATHKSGLHYIIGVTSSKAKELSVFTNLKWRYHIAWLEREIKQLESQ